MKNTKIILENLFRENIDFINKFIAIATETGINLEAFFEGRVFSETKYTSIEHAQIFRTLQILIPQQFNSTVTSQANPTYTASGGAPGSGKTYALEKMFDINVTKGRFAENSIYIGPDSVVLKQMPAYLQDCESLGEKAAYNKWRDASNFIANFMFILAITKKFNIVHDTTATNERMINVLETLGKENYTRNMHFYFAPKEEDRRQAIIQRKLESGSAKVTEKDIVSKAEDIYKAIADNRFIGLVDYLTLYIQEGQFWLGKGTTIPFAIYNPAENPQIQVLQGGKTQIENIKEQVKNQKIREALETTIMSWKEEPSTINKKPRM